MLESTTTVLTPAFMSVYDKSYAANVPEFLKKRPRTDSITSMTSFKSIALSDILDELDETHGYVPVFSAQSEIQWNIKVFPNEYDEDEVNLQVAFGESDEDDNYMITKTSHHNTIGADDTPIRRGRVKSNKKNAVNTPKLSTPKITKVNKSDKNNLGKKSILSKVDKNSSLKKKVTIVNDKDKIRSNSKEVKLEKKAEIKDVPKNNIGSYLFKIDYDYNNNAISSDGTLSYNSNEGKYTHNYYNSQSLVPAYSTQSILSSATVSANGVIRIGAYTKEERQQRIHRFREKKNKRIWRKQIKYDCRKKLADTRPRVKGRFVSRAEELGGDPSPENGDSDAVMVYDNDETDDMITNSISGIERDEILHN